MLCKHQTVLDEPCDDGTSRAIRCNAGYSTTCMKYCNERCGDYTRVIIPKPVSSHSSSTRRTSDTDAYRERIMQAQEDRMNGGCCG